MEFRLPTGDHDMGGAWLVVGSLSQRSLRRWKPEAEDRIGEDGVSSESMR